MRTPPRSRTRSFACRALALPEGLRREAESSLDPPWSYGVARDGPRGVSGERDGVEDHPRRGSNPCGRRRTGCAQRRSRAQIDYRDGRTRVISAVPRARAPTSRDGAAGFDLANTAPRARRRPGGGSVASHIAGDDARSPPNAPRARIRRRVRSLRPCQRPTRETRARRRAPAPMRAVAFDAWFVAEDSMWRARAPCSRPSVLRAAAGPSLARAARRGAAAPPPALAGRTLASTDLLPTHRRSVERRGGGYNPRCGATPSRRHDEVDGVPTLGLTRRRGTWRAVSDRSTPCARDWTWTACMDFEVRALRAPPCRSSAPRPRRTREREREREREGEPGRGRRCGRERERESAAGRRVVGEREREREREREVLRWRWTRRLTLLTRGG